MTRDQIIALAERLESATRDVVTGERLDAGVYGHAPIEDLLEAASAFRAMAEQKPALRLTVTVDDSNPLDCHHFELVWLQTPHAAGEYLYYAAPVPHERCEFYSTAPVLDVDEALRLHDECIQCDRRYRADPLQYPWNYGEEARAALAAYLKGQR
jgi:hypothetical protein